MAQKPAGLVLEFVVSSGATRGALKTTGMTCAELDSTYPTPKAMKLAVLVGTTPIFGFSYPEDETPKDLHAFFMTLATQVETEMTRQGTPEQRPAVGMKGRFYFATTRVDPNTNNTVTWNVLYRDVPISGSDAHIVMDCQSYCRYRLTGTTCQFKFRGLVNDTSPAGYYYGVVCPVKPKYSLESGLPSRRTSSVSRRRSSTRSAA